MKKLLYIIIAFISFNQNAQQSYVNLNGIVLDNDSSTPLEYATISLFQNNDSIVKYGGISDSRRVKL